MWDTQDSKWYALVSVLAASMSVYTSTTAESGSWTLKGTVLNATSGAFGGSGMKDSILRDTFTGNLVITGYAAACILYSNDDGATWQVSTGSPTTATGVVKTRYNPNTGTIVVNALDDLTKYWRSDDGGVTFTEITTLSAFGATKNINAIHHGPGSQWFAYGTNTNLSDVFWVSTDDALTWSAVTVDAIAAGSTANADLVYTGDYLATANSAPQSANVYTAVFSESATSTTFDIPFPDASALISPWKYYVKWR
jgi:hypothetical protein